MSDTPYTDKRAFNAYDSAGRVVPIMVSQKLERERDEALATIEDAKRCLGAIGHDGLLMTCQRVIEERNHCLKIQGRTEMTPNNNTPPTESNPQQPNFEGLDDESCTRILLNASIDLLAGWCDAVTNNGASWDDWDEWYKDACYRPGPLRELIDARMTKIAAEEWKP